jgi:hypothetical protein
MPAGKRGYFPSTPQSPNPQGSASAQTVYVLRLSSPRDSDIRRLRWAIKSLLRRLGLRCLSIEEARR